MFAPLNRVAWLSRAVPYGSGENEYMSKRSTDTWFVYLLRCADGTLYTGITKDLARRTRQHNDGTASRYTRSRRPVKLVYHESPCSQSLALKREAAIKKLTRKQKLGMIRGAVRRRRR
jgi:predicted GIY-YIG superfamily endonuclease